MNRHIETHSLELDNLTIKIVSTTVEKDKKIPKVNLANEEIEDIANAMLQVQGALGTHETTEIKQQINVTISQLDKVSIFELSESEYDLFLTLLNKVRNNQVRGYI